MIRPVIEPVERIAVPPGFHVLENVIGELEIVNRDRCQYFFAVWYWSTLYSSTISEPKRLKYRYVALIYYG